MLSSARKKARLLRAYIAGKPVLCTWQVTYACNFRCRFCDYWKEEVNYSGEARAREATLGDIRAGAAKLAEMGSLLVSVAGGEPLLRPDLTQITAAIAEWHFPFITTNGWLVTEQRARELWDAGVCGISISLDYAQNELHDQQRGMEGAAERAREAVATLVHTRKRRDQRVNVICVLNDRNLEEVETLIRFASENGASFTVQPYAGFKHGKRGGPATDVSARLLALKRRYRNFLSSRHFLAHFDTFMKGGVTGCRAGRSFFNIDNFLNVQKCVEFREEPVGNLRDISPKDLLDRLGSENDRNSCRACWYSCRGEIEALYSGGGLLSALSLFLS